ncbi:phosphatases II [Lentinula edodes]|uniref:Phosphatases II n=1 Tax=Lentinula edodes TaxID=5353 RepID=A0A1Q3E3Y1_LENED|nr:phosphatases II [Lentinula edodes]
MLIHDSQSLPKPHEYIDISKKTENLVTASTSYACTSSVEDIARSRIAQLASQHNVSEYSCLKYGPNGYPGKYVPLSVQAPQTFQELRARQTQWSNAKAWWFSDKATEATSIVLGPSGASGSYYKDFFIPPDKHIRHNTRRNSRFIILSCHVHIQWSLH